MSLPRRHLLGVALAALFLAGCSSNTVAEQANQGSQKGYIAGDGTSEIIPAARRGEPVVLSGTTLDGGAWDSTEHRDTLLVVNVWASWCGPCAKEAPDLVAVASDPKITKLATFIGIDFREEAATGRAQAARWGLPYPSLSDPGGRAVLALQGKAAALPATLILDREGRIAARTLGPVTASTLTGMITDVAAGGGTS